MQKICRLVSDEEEVRSSLDVFWRKPEDAAKLLDKIFSRNEELYRL